MFGSKNALVKQQPRMPDPPPRRDPPMANGHDENWEGDDDGIESGIEDVLRGANLGAEPKPQTNLDYARIPLPPYVEHADGVDQAVQLTSQAVVAQYEAAARTVTDMRAPLQEWVDGHQQAIDDLGAAMKYIDETAQRFRDLGKKTFESFQKSALAIAEVRKTCDESREKIEPPV